MTTKQQITIEDLYKIDGKAEIVNGEIELMPPTGDLPSSAAGAAYVSLRQYGKASGSGKAYTDNTGFKVNLPNRGSLSPDASFYIGPRAGGEFLQGAPIFAVEIRSKTDYGDVAEDKIKKKILDYFNAGTKVVWDVDVLRKGIVKVYRFNDPNNPTIYQRGEIAEAEPALPGWTMPVDDLFD